MSLNLEEYIASYQDFPKEGILFRDVTPIMKHPEAFKEVMRQFAEFARENNVNLIAGPESRGFIFGMPLAQELGVGFVPIRKPGKLPGELVSCKYDLEYGSNEIFMQKGSVEKGDRVLVVDDLLATGGTAKAAAKLIEELGGEVAGFAFVIELFGNGMEGKKVLSDYKVCSLLSLSDQ
ncbi:MAG: adenine phosphoribosyltransferase [Solobacterium sp.]|nr:adenine phosphoribosyltransferase [Solobacterium sp.]